jgi:hypothetical protein
MKLNEVKRLATEHQPHALQAAVQALENGDTPAIVVHGEDEGEMLTHLLGALDVHDSMAQHGHDFNTALRAFAARVRASIG